MMFATVYNTVGLVTAALLVFGAIIWFWLCRAGWVEFPAFMVRGYNIHRARRQAERKLRVAERKAREGEYRWLVNRMMDMLGTGNVCFPTSFLFMGRRIIPTKELQRRRFQPPYFHAIPASIWRQMMGID